MFEFFSPYQIELKIAVASLLAMTIAHILKNITKELFVIGTVPSGTPHMNIFVFLFLIPLVVLMTAIIFTAMLMLTTSTFNIFTIAVLLILVSSLAGLFVRYYKYHQLPIEGIKHTQRAWVSAGSNRAEDVIPLVKTNHLHQK